jgi:hypothetical protein
VKRKWVLCSELLFERFCNYCPDMTNSSCIVTCDHFGCLICGWWLGKIMGWPAWVTGAGADWNFPTHRKPAPAGMGWRLDHKFFGFLCMCCCTLIPTATTHISQDSILESFCTWLSMYKILSKYYHVWLVNALEASCSQLPTIPDSGPWTMIATVSLLVSPCSLPRPHPRPSASLLSPSLIRCGHTFPRGCLHLRRPTTITLFLAISPHHSSLPPSMP